MKPSGSLIRWASKLVILWFPSIYHFNALNFEEVEEEIEGPYWFGNVRESVHLFIYAWDTLALVQGPLGI